MNSMETLQKRIIQIDHYQITKIIGSGSSGTVYLATQESTGQNVAIKVLKTSSDDSDDVKNKKYARFKREMELCTRVQHPNIIQVLDFGELDNKCLYTVFEYIPGKTLASLLEEEGALQLDRCKTILLQILEAIHKAHSAGIIHRDLKPENVMVIQTASGEHIKILDFGISAFSELHAIHQTKITMTHEFLGTPAYSSPEQLRGEPISFKADLFSWGLMAIECITGLPAYQESSVARLAQKMLSCDPVPLPQSIMSHPLGLLLGWVLQKDPYRRAGDALQVLKRFSALSFSDIPTYEGYMNDINKVHPQQNNVKSSSSPAFISQERKQLTILSLVIHLHPINSEDIETELFDEIYYSIIKTCISIAVTHGGYCDKSICNRKLIHFGYPLSTGNDTKKAASTALQIAINCTQRNILLRSQYGVKITYNVGIHTGMVPIRKDSTSEEILIGIAASIASSLSTNNKKNSIHISKKVHSILQSSFDCLSSVNTGEPCFSLLGEKHTDSMLSVHASAPDYFAGRQSECEKIQEYWNNVIEDKGTGILVIGEAGIGKSRIIGEMLKRNPSFNWIELRCTEDASNIALNPVFDFFNRRLSLSSNSSAKEYENLLEAILDSSSVNIQTFISIFMHWKGIISKKYFPLQIAPIKQKQIFLNLLVRFFADYAQSQKSVIIIEDLHWIDATSLEFITELLNEVPDKHIIIMLTTRPSFSHQWNNSSIKNIILERLNDEEINSLIKNYSTFKITKTIAEQVIEKADGNPFYTLELLNSISQLMQNMPSNTSDIFKKIKIPDTLRDLLAHRLDMMGIAKETAQIASVIGRWFDFDLLSKISLRDEGTLLADLDQLVSAGLIHVTQKQGSLSYFFHHALVRDIAYESLTKDAKSNIHKQIAQIIEVDYPDIIAKQPGILSDHWDASGNFEKATYYGLQASQTAFQRSLFTEAANYARKSIGYCNNISDNVLRVETELKLNQILVNSLTATQGYISDEIQAINERSSELVTQLPESTFILFPVFWQLILYYQAKSDYDKLASIFEKSLPIYSKPGFNNELAALYFSKGNLLYFQGKFNDAEHYFKETESLFDDKNSEFQLKYAFDLKVSALSFLCLLHTIKGNFNSATNSIKKSLSIAFQNNDILTISLAMAHEAGMWHYRNNKENALSISNKLIYHTEEKDISTWNIIGKLIKAWALGDLKTAHNTIAFWEQYGLNIVSSYWNFLVAQIEYDQNLFDDALIRLDKYIEYGNSKGELYYLPELYRLKASCLCKLNYSDDCISNLHLSLELSRKLNTYLFEARSFVDLYSIDKNTFKTNSDRINALLSNFAGQNNEPFPEKEFLVQHSESNNA